MSDAPEKIMAGDWERGVFGDYTTDELVGQCAELSAGAATIDGWSVYVRLDVADLYRRNTELAARIEELERERDETRRLHRANIEFTESGLRVCFGDHDKQSDCDWIYYVPAQEQEQ